MDLPSAWPKAARLRHRRAGCDDVCAETDALVLLCDAGAGDVFKLIPDFGQSIKHSGWYECLTRHLVMLETEKTFLLLSHYARCRWCVASEN